MKTLNIIVLMVLAVAWLPVATAAAQTDLVSVLRQYYDAVNRGDVSAAVAMFADDAEIQGTGGCSPQLPCKGKAEIQRRVQNDVTGQSRWTIVNSQVSGNTVTARVELRSQAVQAQGVDRLIFNVTVTFAGDKIARLSLQLDTSDAQSATAGNFSRLVALISPRDTALSRGDVAGAMAPFADDATFEGYGLCATAPCVGKVAIQKETERAIADKTDITTVGGTVRAAADTLTRQQDIRADSIRAVKVERIIAAVTVQVKGDKIASYRYALDLSDTQTAQFASSQRLPKTGGQTQPNDVALIALAGLGLLGLAQVLRRTLALRRPFR